jgi:hypothetical protein
MKLKELKSIAHRDGDGLLMFYFSNHPDDKGFVGTMDGLNAQGAVLVIKKMIENMNLSPQQLMSIYGDGETIQ